MRLHRDRGLPVLSFPGRGAGVLALTFELRYPGLHIADYQDAQAEVWITRNASLLGDGGPATTAGFVYRTPSLGYPEPVVPFIAIADRIEIGPWSYAPGANPLDAVFASVFDGDSADRRIACGVRYGYQLAASADPLVDPVETYLPVARSPVISFQPTTVADVSAALQVWFTRHDPAPAGGRWVFWVDLYSSVDPGLERPVLQLKRLVSVIA